MERIIKHDMCKVPGTGAILGKCLASKRNLSGNETVFGEGMFKACLDQASPLLSLGLLHVAGGSDEASLLARLWRKLWA